MKKILMSVVAMVAIGSMAQAGGDIAPVAPVPVASSCGEGFYVGAALAMQRTYGGDADWFDDGVLGQDKTVPLTGILGYKFNCYLAVEGRISKTVYEEDYADVLTYSIFLKPMYPVTEDLDVYALIGYGVVDAEYTDGDVPAPSNLIGQTIVDKGGFQWGFGASYAVNESWTVFLDYTRLMHKRSISPRPLYGYDVGVRTWDHISDDAINLGVLYRF
jgi:opacity protein-like surface antigen